MDCPGQSPHREKEKDLGSQISFFSRICGDGLSNIEKEHENGEMAEEQVRDREQELKGQTDQPPDVGRGTHTKNRLPLRVPILPQQPSVLEQQTLPDRDP